MATDVAQPAALTPTMFLAPRASVGSWVGRLLAGLAIAAFVFLVPAYGLPWASSSQSLGGIQAAALQSAWYVMVGLGLNVLLGYTGQLSLGQFAFVALGAMTAANVTNSGLTAADPIRFALGLFAAVLVGAGVAILLGLVALRLSGLYLALVTLVFGQVVIESILGIPNLNGHDAGVSAIRPSGLSTTYRIYLLAVALAVVVMYLDRRIAKSTAGRAMVTTRENERVAQAFGVNVVSTKLLAFAFSGGVAALAGAISIYGPQQFSNKNYVGPYLTSTLIFVVMVVVGGLSSRAGVIAASVFFGASNNLFGGVFHLLGLDNYYLEHVAYVVPLLGAVLLLLTIIQRPGGMGEFCTPIARWISGGPFHSADDEDSGGGVVEGSSVRA